MVLLFLDRDLLFGSQNTMKLYNLTTNLPNVLFSRACFYESRATYPVTIVCACLLACLLVDTLEDSFKF